MLLGLTEWIDRTRAARLGGRPTVSIVRRRRSAGLDRADRRPRRTIRTTRSASSTTDLVPIDDPTADIGWSPDPPVGPGEAPNVDELAWLDLALLRRVRHRHDVPGGGGWPADRARRWSGAGAGVGVSGGDPAGRRGDGEVRFARAQARLVVDLLTRHHERSSVTSRQARRREPWIITASSDLRGVRCGHAAIWTGSGPHRGWAAAAA